MLALTYSNFLKELSHFTYNPTLSHIPSHSHSYTISPVTFLTSLFPDGLSQALTSLVSGPLSGGDLLLVTDSDTDLLLNLDQSLHTIEHSLTTNIILSTQHSLLHPTHPYRPAHHTQGDFLTAILLFYWNPIEFLHHLKNESAWNPGYLVLFCLNPYLDTTSLLAHTVVQRSRYILLLQQGWFSLWNASLLPFSAFLRRGNEVFIGTHFMGNSTLSFPHLS